MKKLSVQLTDGLAEIKEKKQSAEKRLSAALQLVRRLLQLLREQVFLKPFPDKPAEIHFFKHVKPVFLAAKIFELERYNLEQSKPVGTREKILAFYESELEIIRRFFRQYAYLYQYYRTDLTELDELYFIRGNEVPATFVPEFGEPDPEFSTCGDFLFAKFRAYELLQEYLVDEINRLDNPAIASAQPAKAASELQWTGDKVNLVEIIYGLYFTGQFNNGNADISLLIRFMELHFKIDLSRTYRDFMDIRLRKKTSTTRFLDQMRDAVLAHIDDDLALRKAKK